MKKRFYIVLVSRDEHGHLNRVPVPLHYAYIFVAAAVIGMFTIAGMAGSYSRMLIKTSHFNELRRERESLRARNASLEKVNKEKDVQVASLGALANEVSALYGLTASKLAPTAALIRPKAKVESAGTVATMPVVAEVDYYKSVDTFYALRNSAMTGTTARALSPGFASMHHGEFSTLDDWQEMADAPSLWPVMGPITSSFGQREDPILGNGEGEFHKGIDISAPKGTPIHATADGTVETAAREGGYGIEVTIDHGHGIKTVYGHMSGLNVVAGQSVSRGDVIGYAGTTGRSTGSHVHYEVRIRNTAVNPYKYLHTTLAELKHDSVEGTAAGGGAH